MSRTEALERGYRLELVTVAWMLVEAVLAIGAGVAARSVLLSAFGLDSLVELLSGALLLGYLASERGAREAVGRERFERRVEWASAALLVSLCAYVVLLPLAGLLLRLRPEASTLGLAVAAIALVAMPLLAASKRSVNAVLQSPALRADIAETAACAYLAAVTLVGVGVNLLFGWWWADYAGALLLLVWLLPEAREALEAARGGEE